MSYCGCYEDILRDRYNEKNGEVENEHSRPQKVRLITRL